MFLGGVMDQKITWLNVTGSPRSGTTALGAALNKSQHIGVLHEHYPKDFFDSIESLFKNQDFHASLGGYPFFADSIVARERDLTPIVESIFSIVFKKSPSIIGSKIPGLQRREKTRYPEGFRPREINIVRNPVDVVNSYLKKSDGTLAEDPEQAFCDWLHSFNYAVAQQGGEDFFWVLYERFRSAENVEIATQMAEFLKIDCDFELEEMNSSEQPSEAQFLHSESGRRTFTAITRLFDLSDWDADATRKIEAGKLIGYPLTHGESIVLRAGGNSWKYVHNGFYSPEPDGSWTRGPEAIIRLTPEATLSGKLSVTLDVSWSLNIHGVGTMFSLYLDDTLLGNTTLALGDSQGASNKVIFNCPAFIQAADSVTLKIVIENPRNPSALGVSADNRDLGLMIRSISFGV